MRNRYAFDVDRIREQFEYNADDECLIEKATGRQIKLRRSLSYGYARATVDGIQCQLHRLVWVVVMGEDPGEMEIDHIDRDKNNNTIENLRCVTPSENGRNRVGTNGKPWCKEMRSRDITDDESDDDIIRIVIAQQDTEIMAKYRELTTA